MGEARLWLTEWTAFCCKVSQCIFDWILCLIFEIIEFLNVLFCLILSLYHITASLTQESSMGGEPPHHGESTRQQDHAYLPARRAPPHPFLVFAGVGLAGHQFPGNTRGVKNGYLTRFNFARYQSKQHKPVAAD